MKKILILLTIFAINFVIAQESYYPSRTGLSWTYNNSETQAISEYTDANGNAAKVLVHYLNGQPVSEDYMIFDEKGVRSFGTASGGQAFQYEQPLIIYPPAPLQVGNTWSSTTKLAGFELSLSGEVVAVRGVQTPVGRFNALQIRQKTVTSTGAQTTIDLFFVPSIGVVKWITEDGVVVDLIEKNF